MLPYIIACELGFWVAVILGLTLRYVARRPRLGVAFLLATPAIDVALLALSIIDLRNGGQPHWSHSMAAFYIGFSVAFGKRMINFADRIYQRKVLHLQPSTPETNEWTLFGLAVLATVISVAITEVCIRLAPIGALGLRDAYKSCAVMLIIWLITGPLWPQRSRTRSTT